MVSNSAWSAWSVEFSLHGIGRQWHAYERIFGRELNGLFTQLNNRVRESFQLGASGV